MDELVDLEATALDSHGTIVEVLRVVDPKDTVEPVKGLQTQIVEWLDEKTFRSTQFPGEPVAAANRT